MSILPSVYREVALPDTPQLSHTSACHDVQVEVLCQIYLKVLTALTGPIGGWVRVDPPSVPLLNHLKVLGIESEAPWVWHSLVAQGWLESYYSASGHQVRFTTTGRDQVAVCPAALLKTASGWYAKVLAHLYKNS